MIKLYLTTENAKRVSAALYKHRDELESSLEKQGKGFSDDIVDLVYAEIQQIEALVGLVELKIKEEK